MEALTLIELIPSLGFPIVMVIALAIFVFLLWKQSVVREEKLLGEITENRLVNTKFAEIIGQYEVTLGEIRSDVKDIKETLHIENN